MKKSRTPIKKANIRYMINKCKCISKYIKRHKIDWNKVSASKLNVRFIQECVNLDMFYINWEVYARLGHVTSEVLNMFHERISGEDLKDNPHYNDIINFDLSPKCLQHLGIKEGITQVAHKSSCKAKQRATKSVPKKVAPVKKIEDMPELSTYTKLLLKDIELQKRKVDLYKEELTHKINMFGYLVDTNKHK